ncbi:hypothetical protein NL676_025681 [Syzygium grande]|nr:hypothetical protein NL676_025681 [Syzygium grande]
MARLRYILSVEHRGLVIRAVFRDICLGFSCAADSSPRMEAESSRLRLRRIACSSLRQTSSDGMTSKYRTQLILEEVLDDALSEGTPLMMGFFICKKRIWNNRLSAGPLIDLVSLEFCWGYDLLVSFIFSIICERGKHDVIIPFCISIWMEEHFSREAVRAMDEWILEEPKQRCGSLCQFEFRINW